MIHVTQIAIKPQSIEYWRKPTKEEIKFGYGAIHYREFDFDTCFDKNGYRLGYGAGYFDNTLRQRPTHTIGIAFALTQIDDLHPSPSDVKLNAILTESAVHSFSG